MHFAGPLSIQLLQEVLYREPAERIQVLGKISDAEGSLYRRYFSPAHIRAASTVRIQLCSRTFNRRSLAGRFSCSCARGCCMVRHATDASVSAADPQVDEGGWDAHLAGWRGQCAWSH